MIRLITLILLLLISLLAIFKAPEYHLWLLAIGVTEFPWLFSTITLLILLTGFWVGKYQLAGTVTGVIALILFLSPIARAYVVAGNLKPDLTANFGADSIKDQQQPFSFFKLFAGNDKVAYKTLTYVTYPDTAMTMDYYPSQIAGKKPCVIVVHGGSWAGGDSQQLPELNSRLAKDGYNVATINYRMAPKYQNPAPVEDIKALLKYLRAHAAELNVDTAQFILLGRSAGAQIALLAAYTLYDRDIKAVIDFYGPADMVWGYSIPSNPLIMDSRKVMGDYLGGTYKQVPQNYINSSPIEFVSKTSIPTLMIHGMNDVLVSPIHSMKLSHKLQENGVKYYELKLPWATHGFDFNLNGPGGQLSTYTVERFLNYITNSIPPSGKLGGLHG